MKGTIVIECPPALLPMSAGLDLAEVYRAHHDLVWRSLRAFGVDAAAVDDATQDVFMVVHRRREDYDGQTPIRRWVMGITRKVALKYRERSSRSASRLRPLAEEHNPGPPELTVVADRADEVVARREAAHVVEVFIQGLDPDKRAIFMLCEVDGLSAPEVSEILGVKLNTVYSRLRVVRQRFEQAIARHQAAARRQTWAR